MEPHPCNLAIKINSNIPEAYNSLGNILFKKELYQEAIEEYDKALKLNPFFSYSLIGRGISYYKNGNKIKCCEDLLNAKKLNPNLELGTFEKICN